MAQITKRDATNGQRRYDVRTRIDGRVVTRTFRTLKDARDHAATIEADKLRSSAVDPRLGRVLFSTYAATWLDTRIVRGRPLAPMTRRGYEGLLRRLIDPAFGKTALNAITVDKVNTWHGRLVAEHGKDAAAKAYRLLRAVLNTAAAEDRIGRNPCRIKGAGIEHAPERRMPTTAEVLDLADAIDRRCRALVLLAGFGGLRTGEMLGLRRIDVDLLRRQVHVRQQAQEVPERGRIVVPPKSDAGRRTVTLPAVVVEALEEHLATFAEPGPDGLVFTGPRGGPLYRARLSDFWTAACRVVGVPGLHVHDLRHHGATLTARMPGITTKELMARIGHSSPRAALIYQHATEERDRAAADFLDEQIARVERPERAPLVAIGDKRGRSRAMDARWQVGTRPGRTRKTGPDQDRLPEAAGGIEPPYGALQAPA